MITFTVDSKAGYRTQIQADTIEQAAERYIEMANGVGIAHTAYMKGIEETVLLVKKGNRILARIYTA